MHKRFQKVQSDKKYFYWTINYNVPLSWKDFKKYPKKIQLTSVKFCLKVTNEKGKISKKVYKSYLYCLSLFFDYIKKLWNCYFIWAVLKQNEWQYNCFNKILYSLLFKYLQQRTTDFYKSQKKILERVIPWAVVF